MKAMRRVISIYVAAIILMSASVLLAGCNENDVELHEPVMISPEQYPEELDETISKIICNYYAPMWKKLEFYGERHKILGVEEQVLSDTKKELTVYVMYLYHVYLENYISDNNGSTMTHVGDYNRSEKKQLIFNNETGVKLWSLIDYDAEKNNSFHKDIFKSGFFKIKLDVSADNKINSVQEVYMTAWIDDETEEKLSFDNHDYRDFVYFKADKEITDEAYEWYRRGKWSATIEIIDRDLYNFYIGYNKKIPENAYAIRLYPDSTRFQILAIEPSGKTGEDLPDDCTWEELREEMIVRRVVAEGTCQYDRGYLTMTADNGDTYLFKMNIAGKPWLNFIPEQSDELEIGSVYFNEIYFWMEEKTQ